MSYRTSTKRAGLAKFLVFNALFKDHIKIKNVTKKDQEILCLVVTKEIKLEDMAIDSFSILNSKELTLDCIVRKLYHKKIVKPGKTIKINCKYDTIIWRGEIIQTQLAFDKIYLKKNVSKREIKQKKRSNRKSKKQYMEKINM